jgi:hypothetical protein
LEKLEEMDKFVKAPVLPKLNQENINIFNRPIMSNEIEAVLIKNQKPPNKRKPRTRWIHCYHL